MDLKHELSVYHLFVKHYQYVTIAIIFNLVKRFLHPLRFSDCLNCNVRVSLFQLMELIKWIRKKSIQIAGRQTQMFEKENTAIIWFYSNLCCLQ